MRKLLKPSKCHEDNMKPLEHDWGLVFLLESAPVIRVVVERLPRSLRKLLKPSKCHEDNMKPLEHDWGSVFLLESATIIRAYGFP